jgi:hypothetical protein
VALALLEDPAVDLTQTMKTIAIPLLLATAAKAEATKRQTAERMAGDFAQA